MTEPEAAPAGVAPSPPAEQQGDASRWTVASKEVRETAKWVITAAGAAAAVVFGAGPIVAKGELTGAYVPARVAVILLGALVGIIGLATLIGVTANVLLPSEWTLDDLPVALAEKIRKSPRSYLPDGIEDVAGFREELAFVRRYTANIMAELATVEERVAGLKTVATPTPEQSRELIEAENELADWKAARARSAYNLSVYESCRWTILGEAGYRSVRELFVDRRLLLASAGVAAVLGATVYLLGVGYKPSEAKATNHAAPRLGQLTKHSDGTSDSLWEAAGLSACTTRNRLPVLVDSGAGTSTSPYVVHTIVAKPGCPLEQFNVINAVATVTFPETTVDICYRPLADKAAVTTGADSKPTTKPACPT